MKKIITFFSVFVLILSILNVLSLSASTPKVYLEDAIKYDNSENVTVSIYMENVNSQIVTLGLDLKYDTSKLEYVSSKAGKDLKATLKLDEDLPEESRVAIGIIAMNGLKNNGLYYQITFKVKDDSSNIPLEISLREATDSDGKDIKVETQGAEIKITKEEIKKEENTTIKPIQTFEVENVDDLTSIEDIISENASIEIGTEDVITYEVEDSNIVEILNDGTIIPNNNGTSKVKLKMNGQDIGTVEIAVKDGKIEKITGKEEAQETNTNSSQIVENSENEIITEENASSINKENNIENIAENSTESKLWIIPIIIVIIILIFIILIIRKKRRKK